MTQACGRRTSHCRSVPGEDEPGHPVGSRNREWVRRTFFDEGPPAARCSVRPLDEPPQWGAGTYVFLVGFGYFDGEGFHTAAVFLSLRKAGAAARGGCARLSRHDGSAQTVLLNARWCW